jgi:hypothetical protein
VKRQSPREPSGKRDQKYACQQSREYFGVTDCSFVKQDDATDGKQHRKKACVRIHRVTRSHCDEIWTEFGKWNTLTPSMKKRLPVNTKRVLFDRQRTFGPKSVEPVLIEFGVAAYGKLSVWESDNWMQNVEGQPCCRGRPVIQNWRRRQLGCTGWLFANY